MCPGLTIILDVAVGILVSGEDSADLFVVKFLSCEYNY